MRKSANAVYFLSLSLPPGIEEYTTLLIPLWPAPLPLPSPLPFLQGYQ